MRAFGGDWGITLYFPDAGRRNVKCLNGMVCLCDIAVSNRFVFIVFQRSMPPEKRGADVLVGFLCAREKLENRQGWVGALHLFCFGFRKCEL